MQGRLLPKYKGNYQAHPLGYWDLEFSIASDFGLDLIEFIFDYNNYEQNPLMTYEGHKKILFLTNETNVCVRSVCADYFMVAPLHSDSKSTRRKSLSVLIQLIKNVSKLKITDIVFPCVDNSSIKNRLNRTKFLESAKLVIPYLEKYSVNLSLETDLPPNEFEKLIFSLDSERITVNYDIGNSASLGYKYIDELKAYGDKISDVHIKDRKLNGGSVVLGKGDANIPDFINRLSDYNYNGPYIMQAFRDNEGISIFKEQLDWFKNYI